MNPTALAMRRPVTTLMLIVALISGGALAYNRMRVDIFPALNVPKIYLFLDYIGMSPDQVEGFITVGYLVFESEITTFGAMGDLAQNVVRPLVQKFVPGSVTISPFGPNIRSIVISVDPQKLLNYDLPPQQGIDALAKGNTIIPAGNIYVKDSMPVVANNATVVDYKRLGDIPRRMEKNVYLRDVATFPDDTDITYGYALVNGKKSVYLPIIKKDDPESSHYDPYAFAQEGHSKSHQVPLPGDH
jgi:multidrug efflux pump subunit AcrB